MCRIVKINEAKNEKLESNCFELNNVSEYNTNLLF